MLVDLILTIISDDKPGIVEALANAVKNNGGNWLESRLTQLAGKFAGVVRIQVDEKRAPALAEALRALREDGINIIIEGGKVEGDSTLRQANFHAVGPDRPGIVKELSHIFTEAAINVSEMNTRYSSMPYSGEPLFEAEGLVQLPEGVQLHDIQEQLEKLANELAIDISLDASL